MKFITFGSHDDYMKGGERLVKQVKELNLFKESILYTPEFLKKDLDFWNKHSEFINKNKRGYGYWLWKPFIIKKTMENMKNGDILLYLDCGCEVSKNKKKELQKCIDIVKKDKIVGTTTCKEKDWNKMDLIKKLNMNKDEYLNTPQHQGGTILFLICDETIELVNKWYRLGCDYHNIDDTPSVIKNTDNFREHRHDQSIFSLLTKKYNIYSKHSLRDSIYILRNKSGISKL
jgi:hypothetical protein